MTDEFSAPIEPVAKRSAGPFDSLTATLPVGALTASVLFDALQLVADNPAQAQSYERGATDILTVGLSGSLVAAALDILEYLRAPASAGDGSARRIALNGALIAVYLFDVAARRKPEDAHAQRRPSDVLPTGLSLLGLALLALAKRT
jgi:hypothetical protein